MKNKLIYAGIIGVIFIAAMFIYKDEMGFAEIVLSFTTSAASILGVWKWISAKELKEDNLWKDSKIERLEKVNESLRAER